MQGAGLNCARIFGGGQQDLPLGSSGDLPEKDLAERLTSEIFDGPRLGKELVMSDPGFVLESEGGFALETDVGGAQVGTPGLRDGLESPGENYISFKNVDGKPQRGLEIMTRNHTEQGSIDDN